MTMMQSSDDIQPDLSLLLQALSLVYDYVKVHLETGGAEQVLTTPSASYYTFVPFL